MANINQKLKNEEEKKQLNFHKPVQEEDEDLNCDTWPKFVEETYQGWVARVRYQLPCIADFKFRFVYCKQIVNTVQDEKFEVLRRQRHFDKYKKVIRFELTCR